MSVRFDSMSAASRIWLYPSDRPFTAEETDYISKRLDRFTAHWLRHGEKLQASYTIRYDQFIILAVDESQQQVSGCAIDDSIRLIKEFETKFGLSMTNRLHVQFRDQEAVRVETLSDFQDCISAGEVDANTIVFNNLISSKADLSDAWEVPAHSSWHQRFFKQ
ncbi:MAG: ABC transporter ATPase [Lutibacter sp.]|jgi:hypothetical protein|nr:ABC transporter ATPase [Lutibacter sp.]